VNDSIAFAFGAEGMSLNPKPIKFPETHHRSKLEVWGPPLLLMCTNVNNVWAII